MKKNSLLIKILIALAGVAVGIVLYLIISSLACGGADNEGGRLQDNIARIYEHDARTSHFMLNAEPIEGEVTGMAFMDNSAEGRTSLAWVSTNLYFISEKGVDKLASGVDTAEISFDGRVAVWCEGNQIKKYCVDDRSTTVLAEGVSDLVQAAISPNSKTMILTVIYEDDEEEANVSLLCGEDGVKELSRAIICFAVSDDADIMYYYDSETKGFTVKKGEETYIISKSLTATTSYNFTRDLSEVTYDDNKGVNHLFCLDTKADTELGDGFGYTEKSDVFSISTITYFTYVNDVDSFRNGYWTARTLVGEGNDAYYVYKLGYIDSEGNIAWQVDEAAKYIVLPDQSRVVWRDLSGTLYSKGHGANDQAKQLATGVTTFDTTADGGRLWYINAAGALFTVKGEGKAERVCTDVSSFACLGKVCAIIKTTGKLCYTEGTEVKEVSGVENCVRFDKRVNMIILYANASESSDGTAVYDAYTSADGKTFTLAYHGVEP